MLATRLLLARQQWSAAQRLAERLPPHLQVVDALFGRQFLARWREVLPSAEVVTLPGAGHFAQEEEPAEVTQALRRLLATAPAWQPLVEPLTTVAGQV